MPTVKLDFTVTAEVAAAQKALAPAVKRLKKVLDKLAPGDLPVGTMADALYDMRQLSKLLGALTTPFDDLLLPSVKAAEERFVQTLKVGESSGVQGMRSRVQVTEAAIPVVETASDGWKKLYAHIKKTGEFDLLGKALSKPAVQERWDQKRQVPGIGRFFAKKVSCTKLSSK